MRCLTAYALYMSSIRRLTLRHVTVTSIAPMSSLLGSRLKNAKLREFVHGMLYDAMENVCSKSYWCHEKNWQTCNDKSCGSHLYIDIAQELGIEVK